MTRGSRFSLALTLLIAFAALFLHLCHLSVQRWPFYFPDSVTYLEMARQLADTGKMIPTHRSWGYALLLAPLWKVSPSLVHVIVLQHFFIWACTGFLCLAFWRFCGRRLWSHAWVPIAAAVLYFNSQDFFYAHSALTEGVTAGLLTLALASWLEWGAPESGRWKQALPAVFLVLATIVRPPPMFSLLGLGGGLGIVGRWRAAVLTIAAAFLAHGVNSISAITLYPPGLSAAAALAPVLDPELLPKDGPGQAFREELEAYQEKVRQVKDTSFDAIWSKFNSRGTEYFLKAGSPDAYKATGSALGKIVATNFLYHPLDTTAFLASRVWRVAGFSFDYFLAMNFAAMADEAKMMWPRARLEESQWLSPEVAGDFPSLGRTKSVFTIIGGLSLPRHWRSNLYLILFSLSLLISALLLVSRERTGAAALVPLVGSLLGYCLSIAMFNDPGERYAYPVQSWLVTCGGIALPLLWEQVVIWVKFILVRYRRQTAWNV